MSKKHKGGPAPVPPDNRPQTGPAQPTGENENTPSQSGAGADFQEQDPKRRLGGYSTAGEHSIQQPRPLNDGE